MKKFLVLLLISILAIFVFAGCNAVVPGEGEGEGEGEVEGVTVEISDSVKINGIDYVKGDNRDEKGVLIGNTITVTFPAPVEGMVQADISDCTTTSAATKFLFPNEDKTVWTGTIYFDCNSMFVDPCSTECGECGDCVDLPCCEAVITIISGACEVDECIVLPVIVDCEPPEVDLNVRFIDCGDPCDPCDETAGVYMEWTSLMAGLPCDDPNDCCADDCSGIKSWTITIGDSECAEPCDIITGTGCPVEGMSDCCFPYSTDDDELACYTIEFEIEDMVGNVEEAEWVVCLDTDEVVSFDGDPVDWDTEDLETEWIDVLISGVCFN